LLRSEISRIHQNSFKITFSIDWRHEKRRVQQACKHHDAQQASRSDLKGVMEVLSKVFENRRDPAVKGAPGEEYIQEPQKQCK
jgi:hypothetical protein